MKWSDDVEEQEEYRRESNIPKEEKRMVEKWIQNEIEEQKRLLHEERKTRKEINRDYYLKRKLRHK